MVRSASAAAVLAMIVLPSVAQAQTPQTHRVVAGETLWSLAQRYYTDPYRWPRAQRRSMLSAAIGCAKR